MIRLAALATLLAAAPSAVDAQVIGGDASACAAGGGPAILATLTGLKDRKGRVKLELYPATKDDFLKDDRDLIAAGKTFRRIWATTPPSGPITLCIRVPHPGDYALFATHDRDGRNKFSFFQDGAGFPKGDKIGMSRPQLDQARITVGAGVASVVIRMQYLRGLGGFAPVDGER